MNDILHKITINAPKDKVYEALSTLSGLSAWWTSTTTGQSELGKTLEFRFGEHTVQMRVDELKSGKRVGWECMQSAPDWIGTKLSFDLTEDQGRTTLMFGHRAWREQNPFFAQCSMKWATFLLSLRDYVETGTGRPFPRDLPI